MRQETGPAMPEGAARALRELVERFQVCWEALPDYMFVKKEMRQIGFTLELSGTHERGVEHPQPGCHHCQDVHRGLRAIADWILPRERRDSDYEILPFDQSIHYDQVRKYRPEVSLRIWIRHRAGYERPVDECEVRCLNDMKERLKELGACQQRWSSWKGAKPPGALPSNSTTG